MSTTPPDADRLIQAVLAELGWDAEATAVAEKVKRLDIGLPCEDEFAVVCGWLGKCRLLHKLDQQQIPISSRDEFQVPDLLALFSTQTTESPLLIEVKSNTAPKLSFKAVYLEKLTRYANFLKAPLLIAWKHHGIWTLFDAKHLKKAVTNYNITLELALRENLLGILAGDVAYRIGAGAGVHFRFRKERLLSQEETKEGRTEQWMMVIEDVAFTDHANERRTDLESEVTELFATWDLQQQEEHTDSHIQMSFVAGSEGMQFAHMALVHLLRHERPRDEQLNWRHQLRKRQVTANIRDFSAALSAALRQKVVYHIFHQVPHTMPDFVAKPPRPASALPEV